MDLLRRNVESQKPLSKDQFSRQRKVLATGVALIAVFGALAVILYGSPTSSGVHSHSIPGIAVSDGLVGFWPCSNAITPTTGSVGDLTGNGNNGTQVNSRVNATLNIGVACSFDRDVKQYIALPPIQVGFPTGDSPRSFFSWIKSTDMNDTLVIFSYGTGGARQFVILNLNQDGPNTLHFSSNTNDCGITNATLENGKWHLVGFTYSGSGNLILYVDGIASSCHLPEDLNTVLSGTANIGSSVSLGNPSYFSGQIAQIRLYSRTLAQSEISELYSAPPG